MRYTLKSDQGNNTKELVTPTFPFLQDHLKDKW